MSSSRERLIDAAFALFAERGYEATTVDDVAERAGVGRTTFFRAFKSKEDVIFPDHEVVVGAIQDRLATATEATALVAVTEAARLVLVHYLTEGARARTRYALTRRVPALRAREISGQQRYQRTFRSFLHEWMGGTERSSLKAELMANAVVTAHNHVLRRWLRGEADDATTLRDFDRAMRYLTVLFEDQSGEREAPQPAAVVVVRTDANLHAVVDGLRSHLEGPPTT